MAEEKKEKKGLLKEFGEFISRGNVLDMAVGIIIGGAFTAIVTALTGQILQPLINWMITAICGTNGLEGARTVLGNAVYVLDETGEATNIIDWSKTNYIDWGAFISAIINFILVAIILFAIIKTINTVRAKSDEAKAKLVSKAKASKEPKEETPVEEEAK